MDELYSLNKYRKKINEIHDIEKNIDIEIQNYSKSIYNKENTIAIEKNIENILNNFKLHWEELDEAYEYKNIPQNFPKVIIERRQREIDELNSLIKKLKERYEALKSIWKIKNNY